MVWISTIRVEIPASWSRRALCKYGTHQFNPRKRKIIQRLVPHRRIEHKLDYSSVELFHQRHHSQDLERGLN